MASAHDTTGVHSSFAEVTVRSERFRVLLFTTLTLLVAGTSTLRTVLSFHSKALLVLLGQVCLGMVIYGAVMLLLLRWAASARRSIPGWLSMLNVVIESLLPTFIILLIWRDALIPMHEALRGPVILLYALVLILSPLRLRPNTCLVAGFVAGFGHLALVLASGVARHKTSEGLPGNGFYTYGAFLIAGGVAARFVAGQLLVYVRSVLAEAEARRKAEQEIAAAAHIQRGLLPATAPDLPGYQFAFWNRPADQTGGDYYDWQLLPDGRLAVTLADVTGHGLGPALVAAFCRAYARATLDREEPLTAALDRVNALVGSDLPPGRFITFVAAIVAPNASRVQLVSAGHGPILIRRHATSSVEAFGADGPPLGVMPDESFGQINALSLEPGDSLILLTDGFFEWACPDGSLFGIERLKQAIASGPHDPDEMIASLRRQVEEFAQGTPQADDLTAVVIRRTTPSPRPSVQGPR